MIYVVAIAHWSPTTGLTTLTATATIARSKREAIASANKDSPPREKGEKRLHSVNQLKKPWIDSCIKEMIWPGSVSRLLGPGFIDRKAPNR